MKAMKALAQQLRSKLEDVRKFASTPTQDSTISALINAESFLWLQKVEACLDKIPQDKKEVTEANCKDIFDLLRDRVPQLQGILGAVAKSPANEFFTYAVDTLNAEMHALKIRAPYHAIFGTQEKGDRVLAKQKKWRLNSDPHATQQSYDPKLKEKLAKDLLEKINDSDMLFVKLFVNCFVTTEDRKYFLSCVQLEQLTKILMQAKDAAELDRFMKSLDDTRDTINKALAEPDTYTGYTNLKIDAADKEVVEERQKIVNAIWFLAIELNSRHRDIHGDHLSWLGSMIGRADKTQKNKFWSAVQAKLCEYKKVKEGEKEQIRLKNPKEAIAETKEQPEHAVATGEWFATNTSAMSALAEKVCAERFFAEKPALKVAV